MKTTKQAKTDGLKSCMALWLHESKKGMEYLSGNLSDELGGTKCIGYFNTNKKNPKEPDVRVYSLDKDGNQDVEIASLWENISQNENRYLSGVTNEKENLIAFYDEKQDVKPYIRVYFKED